MLAVEAIYLVHNQRIGEIVHLTLLIIDDGLGIQPFIDYLLRRFSNVPLDATVGQQARNYGKSEVGRNEQQKDFAILG